MLIRPAVEDDVPQLSSLFQLELDNKNFISVGVPTESIFRAIVSGEKIGIKTSLGIDAFRASLEVAVKNDVVIGFAIFKPYFDPRKSPMHLKALEIWSLVVSQDHRRHGVASKIVNRQIDNLSLHSLEYDAIVARCLPKSSSAHAFF